MSFKKAFFKNTSTFASYSYISQGFEFFSTIILSRLLLPQDYGFVAIIMVFASFMQLFASIGINASVVRSDYGYTFHKQLNSLAIWIGTILAFIMVLLAYPIALFFDNPALFFPTILVSLRFIFQSFSHVPAAILSKKLDFNRTGFAHLLTSITQLSLSIIFAILGFSYWSLIIPMMFSPLVDYFYINYKVKLPFRIYSLSAANRVFRKIRALMGYLSLSNLFTYWSGNADKVVIGKFYNEFDLGLYNRSFRFIMIATKLITSIFSRVLFPSLKKLAVEKGDVNKEYLDIIRIITLFNMPVIALLLMLPTQLVLLLWGKDWIGVSDYLPYIGIILMLQSIFRTTQPVFLLYQKEKIFTYINLANSTIKIIIVIIGSFFSIIHIISFLTLFEIVINLPLQAYYGFYKSFGIKSSRVWIFWFPIFIISLGLWGSIHLTNFYMRLGFILVFNLILLYDLRFTLKEMLHVISLRLQVARNTK
ncbi:MAG: oligosaccharide flippase family protein [bacterium]